MCNQRCRVNAMKWSLILLYPHLATSISLSFEFRFEMSFIILLNYPLCSKNHKAKIIIMQDKISVVENLIYDLKNFRLWSYSQRFIHIDSCANSALTVNLSTPQTSKLYLYQIFHAVKYLHGEKIAHRDLKQGNLLLATKGTGTCVKVWCSYLNELWSRYWNKN